MELEQVKDNTWVLKSWELIPVYRLDAHKCILLDTGLVEQREELQEALTNYGLEPVGVICSHAHILLPPEDLESCDAVKGTPRLADRIILPTEDHITFCGAEFDIVHTPGHTVDHICTRTADNVLYLGDAMMTGRTLHHSKFPFAFCVRDYLDSMRKMRSEPADKFIVAHFGVYDEILPLVDMEARFFAERMLDLLDLIDQPTDPKKLTSDICRTYHITATKLSDVSYFESSSLSYLNYLRGLGYLEAYVEDNSIHYRRTPTSYARKEAKRESVLPKTGQFR